MNIGFIGAGRIGTAFGRYLKELNLNVVGYYSKSKSSAESAAAFTGSSSLSLKELIKKCNYIFITTPDDAISIVWESIKLQNLHHKKIFHMSGCLSSHIFDGIEYLGAEGYSLHPILPITDRNSYMMIKSAVFTVEGNSINGVLQFLNACNIKYFRIDAVSKIKYHTAAVFASNYIVCLGKIAKNLYLECGIPEEALIDALYPLMKASVENIKLKGVENALTGPIVRGDIGIIEKHLHSLSEYKDIYSCLGLVATHISSETGMIDESIKNNLINILKCDLE